MDLMDQKIKHEELWGAPQAEDSHVLGRRRPLLMSWAT